GRGRPEDPGDQGGARAHEPRSQGGEGPRGRRPEAGPREGRQGAGRQGEGAARRGRRHRRGQMTEGGGRAGQAAAHPRIAWGAATFDTRKNHVLASRRAAGRATEATTWTKGVTSARGSGKPDSRRGSPNPSSRSCPASPRRGCRATRTGTSSRRSRR